MQSMHNKDEMYNRRNSYVFTFIDIFSMIDGLKCGNVAHSYVYFLKFDYCYKDIFQGRIIDLSTYIPFIPFYDRKMYEKFYEKLFTKVNIKLLMRQESLHLST